jgi:hypothetical protein
VGVYLPQLFLTDNRYFSRPSQFSQRILQAFTIHFDIEISLWKIPAIYGVFPWIYEINWN